MEARMTTAARTEEPQKKSKRSAEWRLVEMRMASEVPRLLEEGLAAGKSLNQLSKEWGVHYLTVQNWAKELGYKLHWTAPDGRALR
jgi:hypothetical protein